VDERYTHAAVVFWRGGGHDILSGRKHKVFRAQGSLDSANVYMDNSEWELIGVQVERRRRRLMGVDVLDDDADYTYTELSYTVHIRRRSLYYAFNVIVPCVMLSSLTLLAFCLPSNSREKIGLGLTVFLTFSMFMLLIAEAVPATSESIPLIG